MGRGKIPNLAVRAVQVEFRQREDPFLKRDGS
jgi:hypothetical protein